jgi:hypothetical protein
MEPVAPDPPKPLLVRAQPLRSHIAGSSPPPSKILVFILLAGAMRNEKIMYACCIPDGNVKLSI